MQFRLDASSDSLNLENDKDIDYYRQITKEFGSDEFLVVTFRPINDDLFSDNSLSDLKEIKRKLKIISDVSNVVTILDVPLIDSPKISFEDLPSGIRTILDPNTDKILAKKELISSALYSENLIDLEGDITTILVNFKRDITYHNLLEERNSLRKLKKDGRLFDADKLSKIEENFSKYHHNSLEKQAQNIAMIRQILADYQSKYDIYIGGVPMIIADSIAFINNDIKIFGLLILFFTILTLLIIFKSLKWVIAPLLVCVFVIITMLGFLGMASWPVTLVSSNFISLLFIITLSMNIHLMVRYREIFSQQKKSNQILTQKELIFLSVKKMSLPCFYTSITTIVAFGSLVISDITPVIDFGKMMAIGIAISYLFTFILLPNLLLFNDDNIVKNNKEFKWVNKSIDLFCELINRRPKLIIQIFTILSIIIIIGILQLRVENSFINYYKESTEINKGMRLIDNKMGGTTPLNIVIDAPKIMQEEEFSDEFDDFFSDGDFEEQECPFSNGYWYSANNIKLIDNIHNYLKDLPETGKVMSLSSSFLMFKSLNSGADLDNFILTLACTKTSKEIQNILFYPYLSDDGNQLHFNVRIKETNENLRRSKLIDQIKQELSNKFDIDSDRIHLNGMLVLYNNILQSLFESQILTLSFVFLVILGMFLILFRNIKLSLLAIIPNIIVAAFILGIMGWFNIPLDIMTITIAAIAIGIAVDDTIHYIHRFSEELKKDNNYLDSVKRAHNTIGRAMYYTTAIIGFGFFILIFSNFVPTIYFGILTTLSMVFALLADFLLLPILLIKFRPIR
ncbi:MMPL family transporter [Rickettsiales bacterium]|nr:MMPL family transporter [Rickettsiales bacterium]MDB2550351.1 MMPL family transporter [Rickettsiales bacterium]